MLLGRRIEQRDDNESHVERRGRLPEVAQQIDQRVGAGVFKVAAVDEVAEVLAVLRSQVAGRADVGEPRRVVHGGGHADVAPGELVKIDRILLLDADVRQRPGVRAGDDAAAKLHAGAVQQQHRHVIGGDWPERGQRLHHRVVMHVLVVGGGKRGLHRARSIEGTDGHRQEPLQQIAGHPLGHHRRQEPFAENFRGDLRTRRRAGGIASKTRIHRGAETAARHAADCE